MAIHTSAIGILQNTISYYFCLILPDQELVTEGAGWVLHLVFEEFFWKSLIDDCFEGILYDANVGLDEFEGDAELLEFEDLSHELLVDRTGLV